MMNLKNKLDTKKKKKHQKRNGLTNYKFMRLIDLKERVIDDELVRKHFLVQDLGELLEKLKRLKINPQKIQLR